MTEKSTPPPPPKSKQPIHSTKPLPTPTPGKLTSAVGDKPKGDKK